MVNDSSIQQKVARQTLFISVFSILCVCVVAVVGIVVLRQNTRRVSSALGDQAAADSREAMELQTMEQLQTLAKNKAEISDRRLLNLQNYTSMMADNATDIMAHPENYGDVLLAPPSPDSEGVLTGQLLWGDGVAVDRLTEDVHFLAKNQHLLRTLASHDKDIMISYVGTESGLVLIMDEDSYAALPYLDPRTRGWYQDAKAQNSLIWTDVFDDSFGRGLAITCAAPYFDSGGQLQGVVGIGSLLDTLNKDIVDTKIGQTGYTFVLNEQGHMIISPTIQKDAEGNIIRQNLLEEGEAGLQTIAEQMVARKRGLERVRVDGVEYFIAFEPFTTLPWSIATLIPAEEAVAMATESEASIRQMTVQALRDIDREILLIALLLVGVVAILAAVIIRYSRRTARRITDPIMALTRGAQVIGSGDLNHRLDVDTGDEIETLAHTFNAMIDNIKAITGEKERISAELDVAREIQSSMLPCLFPAYPDREEFDIFASMLPAKEVGGDFYDFFLVDDDSLCIVIADVPGKGVPAALFMVIAKTLIKNNAQAGKSPKDILQTVNNQLCENNDAAMFVTAFVGIYQINTGRFVYANAGHNPPLLRREGGDFAWLQTKAGFVLAGMEDMPYREEEVFLAPRDILYLYTDGVTEATNPDNNLFGESRLQAALDACKDQPLEQILPFVKERIDQFADGAEQADDITMLALKRRGGKAL